MSDSFQPESYDPEMEEVLKEMLDRDEDITARGVVRLYPKLNAASSITRNPNRLKLMMAYQAKQSEFRTWRKRLAKRSYDSSAMSMAEKDIQIKELERKIEMLTFSHVAMLRAVGELGGFAKWAKFYESFKEIRSELAKMGAIPDSNTVQFKPDRSKI